MSDLPSPRSSQDVFDQIEDALGATVHGRAFLQECGRRARSDETTLLLDAVARLERRARGQELDRDEVASLVGQIDSALRDARLAFGRSVARVEDPPGPGDPPTLEAFGRETTSAIASFVEAIQDTAWRMRETGFDPSLCDALDEQTRAIGAACRRQDRMLDGLGTIERAFDRADVFVGELRRAVADSTPASPVPLAATTPVTLIDGDIEFVMPSGKDRTERG